MVLSRMASLQVSATGPRPSVIRMKMSTEPRTASPTLSDMDFDSPKLISPVPNRTPGPDAQLIPRVDESPPRQQARPHRSTPKQRLTRFLTTDKRDAFIAALPPTIADTIKLVRKECPSLSATPSGDISLRIRFDGDTTASVKDVLFRVLPEAWPAAISDVLPLVHVDAKIKVESGPERGKVGEKEKTWEDLQREQAPLGVQGWTDRVKAGQEESTAHGWLY